MWECKKCHERIEESFDVCWNCGTSKDGVEDPSFQPEVEPRVNADVQESEKHAHWPTDTTASKPLQSAPGPDHVVASGLVWVFRILAIVGGIWGLNNIAHIQGASRATKEIVRDFKGFPNQKRIAQFAQRTAPNAVFTAIFVAFAVTAFPLGMAELIRLCLLVEENTRNTKETASREMERRGRDNKTRLNSVSRLIWIWLWIAGNLRSQAELDKGFWLMEVKDDYCDSPVDGR